MTTFNTKLFTTFLILGILFFVVIIYTFVIHEVLPKRMSHNVIFDGITVIKNDYADLITTGFNGYEENEHSKNIPPIIEQNAIGSLINLTENLPYAKTENFNIRQIKSLPNRITSDNNYNNINTPLLPNSSLNEDFKLEITADKKVVETFPLGSIYDLLKLEEKKNTDTEKRDIKFTSKDKKLIIFINFTVD